MTEVITVSASTGTGTVIPSVRRISTAFLSKTSMTAMSTGLSRP